MIPTISNIVQSSAAQLTEVSFFRKIFNSLKQKKKKKVTEEGSFPSLDDTWYRCRIFFFIVSKTPKYERPFSFHKKISFSSFYFAFNLRSIQEGYMTLRFQNARESELRLGVTWIAIM